MKIITARPHRLLHEVIARIGALASAGESCMLLVPSQYTLQAELEIMAQLEIEGSFLIDVLSPGRLQSRVFERAGAPEEVIFDERGKCMVLSGIIGEEKENLRVYRSAAQQSAQGLAQKMSALIADFKRSGKTACELMEALNALEESAQQTPAARKLADAAVIYAGYEQRMAGRLADAEDVSAQMLARMERAGVMKNQHVFIYGFDMITPTFGAQIVHMAGLAASLTLAVETDANSAADGRLFAPVNLSLDRLQKMAAEQNIPVERERAKAQLDAPWDICAMEEGLFALGAHAVRRPPEHIGVRAASTKRQEVHLAAARMRRMLADGEDPADIAVVYPRGSGYAPLLASILPQYGVIAHIAEKRAAGAHPLCRFLLSAMETASGGFKTADFIECVQSGFMGLTQEEIDELCAYCEGMDVRAEALKRPFAYIRGGTQEKLDALNASREKACAPLIELSRALRAAKSADDAIAAVMQLLERVGAYDTLLDMRDRLIQEGLLPEADDCAQVWTRLMETLDQLHALLGSGNVQPDLVTELLASGLSALELSALPPAQGSVICGEIGNVRTGRVRTIFAMGMNDAGSGADAGLLTPQEQEEAARITGAYMGMSAAERAALAQLDELKALSGAQDQLIISYALADEAGRALREGTAVQALRRLFPDMPVSGGLPEQERAEMLCAPHAALEAMAVHLSAAADGEAIDSRYAAAYAALSKDEKGEQELLSITRRLSGRGERRMDASLSRALYGRPVMSVSRLETFAQCPYRHFVRYGLAPEQEMKPGVDRAEIGTLYHEAADRFTRAVTALGGFPDVDDETCDRLMDEAVTPLINAWRQSPLGESERGAAIARRIRSTAQRAGRNIVSQFAGSRFRPMDSELVFGRNGAAPIMLELPDGMFVYLQGRIDRVDVLDGETKRIRVIDYKSGAKKFDPTMVYFGIQLQLLLYLAAALSGIPGAEPAGFFYCRIADPTIKSESRVKEEIERQLAKKLSLAGISLSDVEVLRAQDERHAAMITRDGTPSGTYRASMADAAGMDAMVAFARRKAAQLAAGAYAGEIDDAPAAYGQYSACTMCDYSAICGFDPTIKNRRRLSRKSIDDIR